MNKKGTRRTNGEGSIYETIEKHKRKNFLKEECNICKNCKDRTDCNNRIGYDKCEKCENCKTECLKYCDRFYCYKKSHAQITIEGKHTTVGNSNTKKETIEQMKTAEAKVITKDYIKKNGVTLLQIIKKVDIEKFEKNLIGQSTLNRNIFLYNRIEISNLNDFPIQKLTSSMLQDFLNEYKYLSNSEIEKIYNKLKQGFDRAVLDKIISYIDNPMIKVQKPISDKSKRKIEAFEIHEQTDIMNYVTSHNLIGNTKCAYDNTTIKNIILISFLTGMRIGEIGALDYTKDINFQKSVFYIHRTLTKDKNNNVTMGKYTKTGRNKIEHGEIDEREVPFNIFDKDLVINILKEQIDISKCISNNKEHLLFCRKDGNYISHSAITNIFKRICREANIKLELNTGCHIHMCRHTAITRMIESGIDLLLITKIVGHTSTHQIEQTYGHILDKFKNEQLELSQQHYAKNNMFTFKIKNALSFKKA